MKSTKTTKREVHTMENRLQFTRQREQENVGGAVNKEGWDGMMTTYPDLPQRSEGIFIH